VEHPVTRLLTLLELLQAHRRLSGGELARRLGVAPRTVRRYVATLQQIGIPVGADAGRYGGYRLRPGYRLPPLMLNGDEALAIVLGLLAGRRLGLQPASHAVEGALAELHRVLPDALRQQVEATRETVGWGAAPGLAAGHGDPVDTGVLLVLGAATHDRRQVRMAYRARDGETTERQVDPYGIVFQSGRWYLAGWDHLREAVRTFRLDRVQAADVTDRPARRPAGFDPVAHVQRSIATVPFAWTVEVQLQLSPAEARGRVSPTVGTLEERSGEVLLRFGADDLDWAARYLVGLNCRFSVRQPAELRRTLGAVARELLAMEAAG